MLIITNQQRNANQNHNEIAFTPLRMAMIKKTSTGKNVEKLEPLHTVGRNAKWVQLLCKTVGDSSNLKIKLPDDPAIPILGLHPKELKSRSGRDISTPMFIAALFKVVCSVWKQPKCASRDKLTKQMWYICIMEYYSVLKRVNFLVCDNMDGPEGHYAMGNKP